MTEYSSSFQINDQILNIPPNRIRIDRQSYNNIYQTLRTQSSIKSKSGFSTIDVYLTIDFTDDFPLGENIGNQNGFQQLRNLVSQFRVTPFCYVENSFLRQKLLSGNTTQSMAFALKQLEISKGNDPSSVNVITVNLHLCLFNYFPFTRDFSLRKNVVGTTSTKNPADSMPWYLLYEAEQARHKYKEIQKLQTDLVFSFPEYKALTIKRYKEIKDKEVVALQKLSNELNQLTSSKEGSAILDRVRDTLFEELQDQHWARSLRREIFGDTTSMFFDQDSKNVLNKVKQTLRRTLNPDTRDKRFAIESFGWRPVILANGELVTLSDAPSDKGKPDSINDYKPEQTILLVRERYLDFDEEGLIVQGISISFENILAILPLTGHPYPSYQHIGSVDARVSFSIAATDERSIGQLSAFYSAVEEQHHKYRNIPSGFRNMKVENDIVNMCGLEYFLPEKLDVENIEGEPGTYSAIFTILDNPLTPETQEKIGVGQSFTSADDFRVEIIKIIESNLKFDETKWETIGGQIRLKKLLGIDDLLKEASNENRAVTIEELQNKKAKHESSYYNYTGSKGERSQAFRELVEEYGRTVSFLVAQISEILKHGNKQIVSDLKFLNNGDILGIEKINEDLLPLYESIGNKRITNRDAEFANFKKNAFGGRDTGTFLGGVAQDVKYQNYKTSQRNDEYYQKVEGVRNSVLEAQARESLGIPGSETEVYDTQQELAGLRSEVYVRLQGYVNITFQDWVSFIYNFADEILRDSNLLALPQFEPVRQLIKNNRLPLVASDCYPDFPMPQVLSLMEKDENLSTFLNNGLVAAWEEMGLGLKNVGLSSLLNPDFYFFNPSTDIMDEIFPHHIITKAKDSIIQSREQMKTAEGGWFKDVYEQHILGQQKQANLSDLFGTIFTGDAFEGENAPLKNRTQEYQNHLDTYRVMPDGLQGSVGCSTYEAQQTDGSYGVTVESIQSAKPSTIEGERTKSDSQAVYLGRRNKTTLKPPENAEVVRHRFGTEEALSFLPETEYRPALKDHDSSQDPIFIPPTPTTARRITSPFGKRLDPVKSQKGVEKTVKHNGIDIAGNRAADSFLTPIYAAADGKIIKVTKNIISAHSRGVGIHIQHSNGWVTVYHHLVWDNEFVIPFSDTLNRAKEFGISQSVADLYLTVKAGDQIGFMDNTGYSTGSHLHFEMRLNGTPVDPIGEGFFSVTRRRKATFITGIGEVKSRGPILGIDPENESLLHKSVQQFEKDLKNGMGYGMMRAYPTFKLYFIESDLGERKKYAFDDFFSYNSVQEIQIVRHRKIAADLCIIQLTNISGSLNNRKFLDSEDPTLARRKDGGIVKEDESDIPAINTLRENPIASLMLQSGTQVQLRLGYSNSPEELETVFNGIIVEHEFSESSDLVTIVCQSFSVELVQTVQGEDKSFGGWFSDDGRTWQVLNEVLAAPEVVHFGRWEPGGFGGNKQRGLLQNRWRFKPNPQDDNLFPPQGSGPLGLVDILLNPLKAIKGSRKYVMFNTTIWDVVQELTLRHPGYIASTVPYEGEYGPRMSLFFGLPDQLYFARDATQTENNVIDRLRKVVKEGASDDYSQKVREMVEDATRELGREEVSQVDSAIKRVENSQSDEEVEIWLKKISKLFAQARGFIKPFRNYHVATSSLHILHNSIVSSGHNTFNTVTLQYSDDGPDFDEDTAQLNFNDPETFTLKTDAGIPDEQIREMFAQYPNCYGYEMAKLYSVSLLYNSLKESYSGSLILVGNPRIKPFDIIYVFDEHSDCYGPVEVEKVVHRFSQKSGFVTEVTPDLCVHVNQESTLSTQDAMGIIAEHGLRQIGMESLGTIAKSVATINDAMSPIDPFGFSPIARMFYNKNENIPAYNQETSLFGSIGVFIFRKLVTRTQLAHPFRFSPLVLSGKPMIGGLPNRHTDGNFIQSIGDWFKETEETIPLLISDTYDSFKTNYWFGHSEGDFDTVLFGDDIE
jgi:murein DD-endopeptidase MepM/ murein hydrolase activator NlpD